MLVFSSNIWSRDRKWQPELTKSNSKVPHQPKQRPTVRPYISAAAVSSVSGQRSDCANVSKDQRLRLLHMASWPFLCVSSYEPQRQKAYLVASATNRIWNLPAHPHSLSRVFILRMKKPCILCYPKCAKRRFWSDCANAQSDLNLRWAHILEGTFLDVPVHIFASVCIDFRIKVSFTKGYILWYSATDCNMER